MGTKEEAAATTTTARINGTERKDSDRMRDLIKTVATTVKIMTLGHTHPIQTIRSTYDDIK